MRIRSEEEEEEEEREKVNGFVLVDWRLEWVFIRFECWVVSGYQ